MELGPPLEPDGPRSAEGISYMLRPVPVSSWVSAGREEQRGDAAKGGSGSSGAAPANAGSTRCCVARTAGGASALLAGKLTSNHTEAPGLEGSSGERLLQPPAQAGPPSARYRGTRPGGFGSPTG